MRDWPLTTVVRGRPTTESGSPRGSGVVGVTYLEVSSVTSSRSECLPESTVNGSHSQVIKKTGSVSLFTVTERTVREDSLHVTQVLHLSVHLKRKDMSRFRSSTRLY